MKILLFFFILAPSSFAEIFCNPKDKCRCHQNDNLEIQCPTEAGNIVIHIRENEEVVKILIDCPDKLPQLHSYQLPNITINTANIMEIRFCPWLGLPFTSIFNNMRNDLDILEFSFTSSKTVVLTKSILAGLQNIGSLRLNQNNIVDLEENVFESTPNLLELELQDNSFQLKENLFKPLKLLKILDLSGNGIKIFPEGVFQSLKKLKTLFLWNNDLTTVDGALFTTLHSLQFLELSENKIATVAEDAFTNLKNLTQINLSENVIESLPKNLFKNNKKLKIVWLKNNKLKSLNGVFSGTSVAQLDVRRCQLRSLDSGIFENATDLKVLNLKNNSIQFLGIDVFRGLVNLKQLRLQKNQIEFLPKVFDHLKKLEVLLLNENIIQNLPVGVFDNLRHLKKLNLEGNRIVQIDSQIFDNKLHLRFVNLAYNEIVTPLDQILSLKQTPMLKHLDLSHNNISNINLRNIDPQTDILIKLDHNNATFIEVPASNTNFKPKITLTNNPLKCDCHIFDLINFFQKHETLSKLNCITHSRTKQLVTEVPNNVTCEIVEIQCPDKCSCLWRPLDKALVLDCSHKNLTKYPQLDLSQVTRLKVEQTVLNLEGNDLSEGPSYSLGYTNISALFLSHNKIETVTWLPPNLEVLQLHSNRLSHLDAQLLHDLTKLGSLTLHDNFWLCDCASSTLASYLRQSKSTINSTLILCPNTKQRLLDLKEEDLCNNAVIYMVLVVLPVLLAFTLVLVFYCVFKQKIKIFFYSKNMCLGLVTEEDLDRDKIYDAFISYSHKDEEFVVKELLPVLEATPQNYKLCLHYRDWIPGELITTQIFNSVIQSKRTVVILSDNFLDSVWGKMEFRTAHTEAMSEGRTRVIIILYGDIKIDKLDAEMKMYLKTNTYVKWGDPYFWSKLKYALPHRRSRSTNRKHSNEEAFLIGSSPGSTPLISSNPSLDNINPLSFVTR